MNPLYQTKTDSLKMDTLCQPSMNPLYQYWDTPNNPLIITRMSHWARRTLIAIGIISVVVIAGLGVAITALAIKDYLFETVVFTNTITALFYAAATCVVALVSLATLVCLYESRHECQCFYPYPELLRQYSRTPPDHKDWLALVYQNPILARYLSVSCDDDGRSWSHVPSVAEVAPDVLTVIQGETPMDTFIRACEYVMPDAVTMDSTVSTASYSSQEEETSAV
jgi:hypothetical protein